MATNQKRRAGFFLVSPGCLLAYVLSNAFMVWLSAGLSEARDQERGLQTYCTKLAWFPVEPQANNLGFGPITKRCGR